MNETVPAPGVRKKVVILGALSAIAIATARIYAAEGAALTLVARNKDRLQLIVDDLKARGASSVQGVELDLVAESEKATQHLDQWSSDMSGLDDVLIFYGYLGDQAKASSDMEELGRILSVNFTSAVLWSEAYAMRMRRNGKGALVVVTSVAGDRGRQSNYAYGAAKGGLSLYIQGLAHSLASSGARAVSMKLGFVDTPMTDGLDKSGPLWATPEQVAPRIRKATEQGGAIQYAPWFWRYIMLIIRSVPEFVFHRTKL